MKYDFKKMAMRTFGTGVLLGAMSTTAFSAQVIATDLVVQGSICVGFDCVSGESFGFDTLRMKENNLRIHAQDTSNSASFPGADWRIVFNETSNGGTNKYSIEDSDAGTNPFTIIQGAGNHAIYVSASGGNVGMGTSSPVVELHVADGDSPTVRLEQNGANGWTPQTWDLAGNETNFFVRDVTNGSKLPFKIRPGAGDNALYIAANSDIGIGTASPAKDLHILNTSSSDATEFQVENSAGGAAQIRIITTNKNNRRLVGLSVDGTTESYIKLGDNNLSFFGDSNNLLAKMTATGFQVGATQIAVPDYVFEDDYVLRPLQEVSAFIETNGHLPDVPSATTVNQNGLNMTQMQMVLLRKVEELTLYTLEQEARAIEQDSRIDTLMQELATIKAN